MQSEQPAKPVRQQPPVQAYTRERAPSPVGAVPNESVSKEQAPQGLEPLRLELAKWQARVPKLTQALRARTEELTSARAALRDLQAQTAADADAQLDARLQARDALNGALEEKLSSVRAQHAEATAALQAAQVAHQAALEDVSVWRDKWQAVKELLDTAVAGARTAEQQHTQAQADWQAQMAEIRETHATELEHAQQQCDALELRNAELLESMALAERQIVTLGEDVSDLVEARQHDAQALAQTQQELAAIQTGEGQHAQQLTTMAGQLADAEARLEDAVRAAERERQQLTAQLTARRKTLMTQQAERQQQVAQLRARLEELEPLQQAQQQWEAKEAGLRAELKRHQHDAQQAQAAQTQELDRLGECIEQALKTQVRIEEQRRQLALKADDLEKENRRLKANLEERSALVRELEDDQQRRAAADSAAQRQIGQLQRELKETGIRLHTFQEHARALQNRIDSQSGAIQTLETRLRAAPAGPADVMAVAAQKSAVPPPQPPSSDTAYTARLEALCKEQNQRCERLQAELITVREALLSAQKPQTGQDNGAAVPDTNDLTRLKGVGARLAAQLKAEGIVSLQDMAAVQLSMLSDPAHPLHAFRARMVRNDWPGQARALLAATVGFLPST